jgi:hypothetical protein
MLPRARAVISVSTHGELTSNCRSRGRMVESNPSSAKETRFSIGRLIAATWDLSVDPSSARNRVRLTHFRWTLLLGSCDADACHVRHTRPICVASAKTRKLMTQCRSSLNMHAACADCCCGTNGARVRSLESDVWRQRGWMMPTAISVVNGMSAAWSPGLLRLFDGRLQQSARFVLHQWHVG